MFTTEEKVNLLKKMQKKWNEDSDLFGAKEWAELAQYGVKESFIQLSTDDPEEITMQDILAEER